MGCQASVRSTRTSSVPCRRSSGSRAMNLPVCDVSFPRTWYGETTPSHAKRQDKFRFVLQRAATGAQNIPYSFGDQIALFDCALDTQCLVRELLRVFRHARGERFRVARKVRIMMAKVRRDVGVVRLAHFA